MTFVPPHSIKVACVFYSRLKNHGSRYRHATRLAPNHCPIRQRGLGEVYRARDLNLKRDRNGRGHQLTISVGRERLGQVFVHRLFEATQSTDCSIVVERQQLHHVNSADVFNRIHPELRVEDAGPAHAASAAKTFHRRVVRRDLKSETELILAGTERERFRALLVRIWLGLNKD